MRADNFCTTSLEGDYVSFYNSKTRRIEKKSKKEFIDIILNNATRKIEAIALDIEFNDEDKKWDDDILKKLQNTAAESDRLYMNHKKTYERSISELSYNNKEMVLTTWDHKKDATEEDDSSMSTFHYALDKYEDSSNSESSNDLVL